MGITPPGLKPHVRGLPFLEFTIDTVTPDGHVLGVDSFGVRRVLPLEPMRARGLRPIAGEIWMISNEWGNWNFVGVKKAHPIPITGSPRTSLPFLMKTLDQLGVIIDATTRDATLPTAAIAQTFDRDDASQGADILTTGHPYGFPIELQAGQLVTSITFVSGATALVSGTHLWFGLLNNLGVGLRLTADALTAAWAADTPKTLALTTPFTTTYQGTYYLAIMVTAATMPTLVCSMANLTVLSIPPIRAGKLTTATAYTVPPVLPWAAGPPSVATPIAYAYAS